MIKNIPNKYHVNLLKRSIDANPKLSYDFFYLPIDSQNNCNVGYIQDHCRELLVFKEESSFLETLERSEKDIIHIAYLWRKKLMDRRHSKRIITPIRSKNTSKLFRKSTIWKSTKTSINY